MTIGTIHEHGREQMRGGRRFAIAVLTVGLALGPAAVLAQGTQPAASSTPATDAIGPRELKSFSLDGNPAPQGEQSPALRITKTPTAPSAAGAAQTPSAPVEASAASGRDQGQSTNQRRPQRTATVAPARTVAATSGPLPQTPSTSVAAGAPILDAASAAPIPVAAPGFASQPQSAPGTLAPERGLPVLPWLLAALALGAGAGFLFWRNRSRAAFAGGAQLDAFSAPEPAPTPAPAPRTPSSAPEPPRAKMPGGIVSTGLRPQLEITMHPLRCIFDDAQVTIEFELELVNSGSAPARGVLIEASLFNAGAAQDREIGAFMARPAGQDERIDVIQPLKRMELRTQVVTSRDHVQLFDVGGRQVFVPLIAFNALYRWTGGEGQTSVSYLLGRNTNGEKMAPFRADLGPRLFRGLGARLLPTGVRK